ncbi:MAG: hypothetical protein ACYDAZ_09025, partial [Thermoplasmataceae archaeon]
HAAYLASWATVVGRDPKVLGQAIDHGARAATYLSRQLAQVRGQALEQEPARLLEVPHAGRDTEIGCPDSGIGF